MKRSAIWRPLACLLAVLLLTLSLPSCTGKVLYQVTVDDLTYTLRGVGEHVEQITVTRDGKRVGSYQKRGIKGELGGESYGFFVSDLNFDGHLDMFLLTGITGTFRDFDSVISASSSQPEKASLPITITLSGIMIDSIFLQFLNASFSMRRKLLGIVISVRLVQFLNELCVSVPPVTVTDVRDAGI